MRGGFFCMSRCRIRWGVGMRERERERVSRGVCGGTALSAMINQQFDLPPAQRRRAPTTHQYLIKIHGDGFAA